MSDRKIVYFDCLAFKETKTGKKRAIRIGSATQRDDGGFHVYLDALPTDGNFAILPQKDRSYQRESYGRKDDEQL